MKQIGRRIYYEKTTGNIVFNTGERRNNVRETTIEEDFQFYQALKERVRETVGVIELEYGQYSQDFQECNGYRVNPETLELEFSYPDPNLPPEEQEPVYRKPLSEEVKDLEVRLAQNTAETLELVAILNEQQKVEQAQSNAEMIELILSLQGGM